MDVKFVLIVLFITFAKLLIMKKIIVTPLLRIALFAMALLAVSCGKDTISPEALFKDSSKTAQTKIATEDGEYSEAVFQRVAVYRKSDFEGQSWLSASSAGKMSYDFFILSVYFQDIDGMKIGEKLSPSRFMFSFPFSSNSEATTFDYSGKILLADKDKDYVILDFKNVRVSCSFGKYTIDGYLYCPLYDEYMRR